MMMRLSSWVTRLEQPKGAKHEGPLAGSLSMNVVMQINWPYYEALVLGLNA